MNAACWYSTIMIAIMDNPVDSHVYTFNRISSTSPRHHFADCWRHAETAMIGQSIKGGMEAQLPRDTHL